MRRVTSLNPFRCPKVGVDPLRLIGRMTVTFLFSAKAPVG